VQGIEGLVHISELSDQHVESPEAVLTVGDEVRVKVIDVDVSRRRISLSMRQVGGQPLQPKETEIEAEAPGEARQEPMAPAPDFADVEQAVEAAGEPAAAAPSAPDTAAAAPSESPTVGAPAVAQEAAPAAETQAETPPATPEPEAAAAEEDVSLESILADLKRREGRE
jgi:small subunit ribosomal protein S1